MQELRVSDGASGSRADTSANRRVLPGARVAERAWIALGALTGLLMLVTVVAIFTLAPIDAIQGEPFRILYFHAPMGWVAYLAFFVVFVASIAYLWRRDERWDAVARASAELGVLFATLLLITGSIWGRPIWNAWWDWSQPRLTVTFILWFVYAGYLLLRSYTGRTRAGARMAAVLGIAAFVSVPLDYLSANWWNAVYSHPATNFVSSSGLPGTGVAILLLSFATFTLLFALLLALGYRLERLRARVERLRGQVEEAHP